MSRTVPKSLAETFREILDTHAVEMHTALPGIVESYDHTTQRASVKPGTQRVIPVAEDTDDEPRETLPILQGVRVVWPGGGGFYLHFPLEKGDTVLLVFPETDINAWAETGDVSDPGTPARFTLSGAIALPMLRHKGNPIDDASGQYGRIGSDGGARIELRESEVRIGGSSPLAKASKADAIYEAINGASVLAEDGGATFKANIIAALNADTNWTDGDTSTLKGD